MRIVIVVSVLCIQLQSIYGKPAGVGAYAYQDSTGNRYGGTYGLKDGQGFNFKDIDDVTTFGPNPFPDFQDVDSFFPEYFRNLERLIQEIGLVGNGPIHTIKRRFAGFGPMSMPMMPSLFSPIRKRAFAKSMEQQRKALDAARKAFDLTSNQAAYVPNLDTDFNRFPGFANFGFPQPSMSMPGIDSFMPSGFPAMRNFASNSAFASSELAPGYRHQMVAVSPSSPNNPNIDVTQFSEPGQGAPGGFYSVQSSSYVTSSNVNGQETSQKGGQTIVNDNGKITRYSLND